MFHIACLTCATALHDTDSERPHEVLTDSDSLADLFWMAHHNHAVREASVDA